MSGALIIGLKSLNIFNFIYFSLQSNPSDNTLACVKICFELKKYDLTDCCIRSSTL